MPAVQTTFPLTQPAGRAGQIATEAGPPRVLTRIVQSAAGSVPGTVCLTGTVERGGMNVGDAGAGAFDGIWLLDPTVPPSNVPDLMPQYHVGQIIDEGHVFVNAAVAVVKGQPAFYTAAGLLTNVSTANTAIPNGTFDVTGPAGLSILRLR